MRCKWMLPILFGFACSTPTASLAHRVGHQSYPYELQVVDANGSSVPTYTHAGRTYVLGIMGARYQIRVKNHSGGRIEAVLSVDGRDVIDGKAAGLSKRGYIVNPYSEVTVDGFRLSTGNVAAFRFSSVASSYASRMGNAMNVGVIGLAVFTEAPPPPPALPIAPSDPTSGYDDMAEGESYRAKAEHAPSAGGDSIGGLGASRDEARQAPAPSAPRSAPSAGIGAGAGAGPQAEGAAKGDALAKRSAEPARERPGLGTAFGEVRYSPVTQTEFVRAQASAERMLTLRYNDRNGLLALGIDVDGSLRMRNELRRREAANPFPEPSFATPPVGWNSRE